MAIGTITKPSGSSSWRSGNKRFEIRDVQLTSGANYTTGGETVTAKQVGMNARIQLACAEGNATTSDGATQRTVAVLRQSDGSVKLVVSATASAQVAGSSDQSTYSVRILFIGH